MICVDRRVGSADLAPLLDAHGIETSIITLPAGDLSWLGQGPEDSLIPVGVEVKRVSDLVQSLTSGRLSGHQLPALVETFPQIWLVVEGPYRAAVDGVLEVPRGSSWAPLTLGRRRLTYREIEGYLTTLEVKAGIHCRRTWTRTDTAALVAAIYKWWQKPFADHHAHQAIYSATRDSGLLYRPSLTRRMAAELPGVGLERSGAVADYFQTPERMVLADVKEWIQISGIGKTLAARIVQALRTPCASTAPALPPAESV